MKKIVKSEEEWRKILTPEQYKVIRQQGTEPAFTGAYWDSKKMGTYRCAACGLDLFDSDFKYDSGTGWPSFWKPADPEHLETQSDISYGMVRTEVHCRRCGAHLGHLFEDGPPPSGLRYCINSLSLDLDEREP